MAARALLLTSTILLLSLPALADSVGNVGAVNQAARGTPPGGSARALSVGLGVASKERIETNANGNVQIVFRDKSTMTVGHSSSVTIDKFVYAGDAKAASQGVALVKGVLRFVGGEVSHARGASVKTPTASIGIRGGTALIRIGGSCGTLVVLQFGVARVANSQGSALLTQPGFAVCAPLHGPISAPFQPSAGDITAIVQSFASTSGQTGGAAIPPTNADANRQLSDTRPTDPFDGLNFLGTVWFGNTLVQSGASAGNQPALQPPETPVPPVRTIRDPQFGLRVNTPSGPTVNPPFVD